MSEHLNHELRSKLLIMNEKLGREELIKFFQLYDYKELNKRMLNVEI
jgi:hypothetical protein